MMSLTNAQIGQLAAQFVLAGLGTLSIRDFVQGDYLSGTIRMIDALLVAACIAIGTGFVLWCTSLLTGVTAV